MHAARPENPADLGEEGGHRVAIDVLEHVGVVHGVGTAVSRRDTLPQIVNQDIVHPVKERSPLVVHDERSQPPANRITAKPRLNRPVDIGRGSWI